MEREINLDRNRLSPQLGPFVTGQLGNGRELPAIGLWPFWGTAIANGTKTIETRSWYRGFRGPLAIYQTKTANKDAVLLYQDLQTKSGQTVPYGIPHPSDCPLGCIVAIVRVVGGLPVPRPEENARLSVRFFAGDGTVQTRIIPPDPPELFLGDYGSNEEETRRAWILTDVYTLPEPLPLPSDGSIRQGIFKLPPAIALPLLSEYRAFLISIRPKCKHCGAPVGVDIPTAHGVSSWLWNESDGWRHNCAGLTPRIGGNGALKAEQILEDPRLLRAFAGGDFPRIPDLSELPEHPEKSDAVRVNGPAAKTKSRTDTDTLSLF